MIPLKSLWECLWIIRVCYFNVTGLNGQKLSRASTLFNEFDLVFLAETWHIDISTIQSHPYFVSHTPNNSPRETGHQNGGIACFSRYKHQISSHSCSEFTINVTFAGIRLSAIYLPPRLSDSRVDSILSLTGHPHVLFGDVNVRYGSINNDTAATAPGRRDIISQHCNRWNIHWIRNSNHSTQISRTDHVYSTQNIIDSWEYVPENYGISSDHFPMILTTRHQSINLTRRDIERFPLGPLREDKSIEFILRVVFTRHFLPIFDINDIPTIDNVYNNISQRIIDAASKVLSKYTPNDAKQAPDTLLSSISSDKTSPNESIRLFKRLQRCNTHNQSIQSSDPLISVENAVETHYKSIFQSIPARPLHERRLGIQFRDDIPPIQSWFSPDNIVAFFKQYPDTKSCGIDGIHVLILRALCRLPNDPLSLQLSALFQACIRLGYSPRLWNHSVIYPLAKTSDSRDIKDFRPVALTPMIRRCFEALLLRGSLEHPTLSEQLRLHDTQAGFQQHQSCLQHLLAADDYQIRNAGPQIFVDLKSAYDRVSIDLLLEQLWARQLPVWWSNVIASLFSECSTQVAVNGSLTSNIKLYTGLFQGSLLAPLLWNIYIDPLAFKLNQNSPIHSPRALFYADDIRLQYPADISPSDIQSDLDAISQWAQYHNMIPSNSKSAIVCASNAFQLTLAGSALPRAPMYRYLGMEMGPSGIMFDTFITRTTTKAFNLINWLRHSNATDAWRESIKVSIVKAFVRPSMEYAFPLVSYWMKSLKALKRSHQLKEAMDAYQRVYKASMCWIFQLERFTRNSLSLAGFASLEHRGEALEASFKEHILNAPATSVISHRRRIFGSVGGPRHLLKYTFQSDLHSTWCSEQKALPQEDRISIQTYLRRLHLKALCSDISTYGKNTLYIPPSARTNGGMDLCLDITDDKTRRLAIQWRFGKLFHIIQCSCGSPFTRSHLRCYTSIPALWSPRTLEKQLSLKLPLYCSIDECLNARKFAQFRSTLNVLSPAGSWNR